MRDRADTIDCIVPPQQNTSYWWRRQSGLHRLTQNDQPCHHHRHCPRRRCFAIHRIARVKSPHHHPRKHPAADLHYRLDVRARNFRLQRSQTVATLFPFQDASRRPLSDPSYMEIVGAITDELDLSRLRLADRPRACRKRRLVQPLRAG